MMNSWGKVLAVFLTHHGMEKLCPSFFIFEEVTFQLLAEEHLVYILKVHQLETHLLICI